MKRVAVIGGYMRNVDRKIKFLKRQDFISHNSKREYFAVIRFEDVLRRNNIDDVVIADPFYINEIYVLLMQKKQRTERIRKEAIETRISSAFIIIAVAVGVLISGWFLFFAF